MAKTYLLDVSRYCLEEWLQARKQQLTLKVAVVKLEAGIKSVRGVDSCIYSKLVSWSPGNSETVKLIARDAEDISSNCRDRTPHTKVTIFILAHLKVKHSVMIWSFG